MIREKYERQMRGSYESLLRYTFQILRKVSIGPASGPFEILAPLNGLGFLSSLSSLMIYLNCLLALNVVGCLYIFTDMVDHRAL